MTIFLLFDAQLLVEQNSQLFLQLKIKIEKSAKELSRLNSAWKPREQDPDLEMITEEERQCLHKIGMKMNSNLLLGKAKFPLCTFQCSC